MDGSIQKYMAFVKTVECGSFTKAAEQLSYSQSGISRMINDLEKEWKVVLLERSKSGVKLTSSGMKLLPYAERVCREYEKLQLEVDELQGLKSGLIRIGTFSSVATHIGCRILSRNFRKIIQTLITRCFWGIIRILKNGSWKGGLTVDSQDCR